MAEKSHPLVEFNSYAIPLRIMQCILAVLGIGLAAYTISKGTDWREAIVILAAVKTLDHQTKA